MATLDLETSPESAKERPVLVCVDDDARTLASLRRALAREPFDVVATVDPYEALSRIERGPVSVLIADQRMPEMSGLTLLRLVQDRSPRTRRVLITGLPDPQAVASPGGSTVERWFGKPWDDAELLRELRSLVGRPDRTPPAVPASLGPSRPFLREVVAWLEGGGKRGLGLLVQIAQALADPAASEEGLVILLRNLSQLQDSPETFLRALLVGISRHGVKTDLVDPSGRAAELVRRTVEAGPWLRIHGPPAGEVHSRRLLLVCPDAVELGFLRFVLSARGHRCVLASTLQGAIRRLGDGPVDVAVIDGDLPNAGSMDLLEELVAKTATAEAVLLSARPQDWSHDVYERWRIRRCLRKPFGFQEVLDAIDPPRNPGRAA